MAQKYSTALVNLLTGGRNLRSVFDNCLLRFLSGAAPADADAAETGTLLCIVSLASAWVYATGQLDKPTVDNWYFTVPNGPTAGNSVAVAISLDGVNGTYTYTATGTDGGTAGTAAYMDRIADVINQAQRPVRAIGFSGGQSAGVMVSPVIRGLNMTLVDGGGNYTVLPYNPITFSRPNTLQFGPPTLGVISKLTEAWTGVNITNGVAGYFRLVLPNDTFAGDTAFTMPRVQGSVGTSGADLNLDSVQFVTSAVTTITAFSIQEPTSA